MTMTRTTISLPAPLLKQLRLLAAQRGMSIAGILREAAEEKVSRPRPLPRSLGMGDSGFEDTSELAGDWKFEPRAWR